MPRPPLTRPTEGGQAWVWRQDGPSLVAHGGTCQQWTGPLLYGVLQGTMDPRIYPGPVKDCYYWVGQSGDRGVVYA